MPETIHSASIEHRRGVALLTVLLIVLAVTIIGTGFLARADTELACGGNMLLRTQMDHLADSGLEHARGMLLHPQEASDTYWTGETALQLVDPSSDYYDVSVIHNASDVTDYCTYDLACTAYRVRDGSRVGESSLAAQLRLDPCVAFWRSGPVTFGPNWVLHGDLYSAGTVVNQAAREAIDGDVFCSGLAGAVVGQVKDANELSLAWPPVTSSYVHPDYPAINVSGTLSGYYGPASIWRASNDLILGNAVTMEGMLRAAGNVVVSGEGVRLQAGKNLPVLHVGGNLVIEEVSDLQINGLCVVDGNVQISAAANVAITGGLFVNGEILETTADSSGNGNSGRVHGGPRWTTGQTGGALELDGIDDFVDGGLSALFDLAGQITVAAWVRTKDAGNGQDNPYVTKGNSAYALRHIGGNAIEFGIYDGGWQSVQFPVNASFNDVWHHIAATYDGNEIKLYIDGGTPKATTLHAGSIQLSPGDPLCIGADSRTPTQLYSGAMDDVRIYDRALPQAEIDTIRIGGTVSGLVGQWALDEPGSHVTILAEPMISAIIAYPDGFFGPPVQWGPAVGGFFRSIHRQ